MNSMMKIDNAMATMTSREIAELTGKRHDNIMRDIRSMIEQLSASSELSWHCESSTYTDEQGKPRDMYVMDKDTTYTLIAGYRADLRFKIIKRWQELEAQAIKSLSPAEFLLQQAQMMVEIERKSREHEDRIKRIECKQQAFEDGIRYFTVIGYVGYKGLPSVNLSQAQKIGKVAKQLSIERGLSIDRVRDQRHGLINSYHETILDDAYAAILEEV